jgi:hypothetical protein
MTFFFVKDSRHKYRFFSSQPEKDLTIQVSRSKKIWEQAKKKLLLLPPRLLSQEQAFIGVPKSGEESVPIVFASCRPEKRVRFRFSFFLQKQRSKHILLLIGESILLPISGLAALLPGPNVFFYFLALLMITQWQALRGINRLVRKRHEFHPSSAFCQWEDAVTAGEEGDYPRILQRLEAEYRLARLDRILWKKAVRRPAIN